MRRIRMQHLGHAGDCGRRLCRSARVVARHQDVDVSAQLLRSSDRVKRR